MTTSVAPSPPLIPRWQQPSDTGCPPYLDKLPPPPAGGPADNVKVALDTTAVDAITGRLITQLPALDPTAVAEAVARLHQGFDGARVRAYVPVLVERAARSELGL